MDANAFVGGSTSDESALPDRDELGNKYDNKKIMYYVCIDYTNSDYTIQMKPSKLYLPPRRTPYMLVQVFGDCVVIFYMKTSEIWLLDFLLSKCRMISTFDNAHFREISISFWNHSFVFNPQNKVIHFIDGSWSTQSKVNVEFQVSKLIVPFLKQTYLDLISGYSKENFIEYMPKYLLTLSQ